MWTSIRIFVFAGLTATLLPAASISEESRPPGYVTESYPGTIVTGGFGQCLPTTYGSAQGRGDPCASDTAAAQPRAPVPAQAEATPAPVAPAPAQEPPPAAAQATPPAAPQPPPAAETTAIPAPPPDTS